jgi:hypothetical protein
VYEDFESAETVWKAALLRLPAVQIILQSLHGKGPVPVRGVVHYLASHGHVGAGDTRAVRVLLTVLRSARIVAYSNQKQTVRITVPIPDSGGPEPKVRVVNPDRPYTNLRHLREVLRACRDHIWWVEPHFVAKLLEPLSDEADAGRISEIRILTGAASTDEILDPGKKGLQAVPRGDEGPRGLIPGGGSWMERAISTTASSLSARAPGIRPDQHSVEGRLQRDF